MRNNRSFGNWSKGIVLVALLFCGLTQFATARWRPTSSGDSLGAFISAPVLPPVARVVNATPVSAPKVSASVTAGAQPVASAAIPPAAPGVVSPAPPVPAQNPPKQATPVRPLITQPVDETVLTKLAGNTHPYARPEFDQGAAPQDLPMQRMLLVLGRTPEQDAALKQYMDEQQDKSSPNYHVWLTPEQFGQQYGLADSDIQTVTSWLQSHGFSIGNVTKGRVIIEFSGTAAQVQEAFHTEIHKYTVNGKDSWANASDPQIPTALTPIVHGFASLNNFPRKSHIHVMGKYRQDKATGETFQINTPAGVGPGNPGAKNGPTSEFTYSKNSTTFYGLGPADFAAIYNVQALWNAGITGTGQTLAIVGQTDVNINDINAFRSMFGLPANPPQIILNGTDPGFIADETESDADLEWSGAVAKNATIKFVTSASTANTAGIDLSALYIIENNVAPIFSESYGECEFFLGVGGNAFYNLLWQQAAAEGITAMLSSGDAGVAGCDQDINIIAFDGLAVNGQASTPYNVSVGGTDFDDVGTQTTYFNTTNAVGTQLSAKSYIPEVPWNDGCAQNGLTGCVGAPNPNGRDIVGGSGGPSNCLTSVEGTGGNFFCTGVGYPKPSWQAGPGVPADGVRDQPDVSLFASNVFHGTGYVLCQSDVLASGSCDVNSPFNDFIVVGGTSLSSPAFAGMMALVNQEVSTESNPTPRQGNANPTLYKLAQLPGASCNSSLAATITNTACIFYDVTKGTNSVACYPNFYPTECSSTTNNVPGVMVDPNNRTTEAWTAGTGYDMATGLGTINAFNLAMNWNSVALLPSSTTLTLNGGTGTVSIVHGAAVTVAGGITPTAATGSIALETNSSTYAGVDQFALASGAFSGTTHNLPGGSYSVHAHYAGDGNVGQSDSGNINVTVTPENSFTGLWLVTGPNTNNPDFMTGTAAAAYGSGYALYAAVVNSANSFCTTNPEGQIPCATGTISITDNGNAVGTFPMNTWGHIQDSFPQLTGGGHNLVATFSGDASYNSSFSATTVATISQAGTTASILSSSASAPSGTPVTLTANIGSSAIVYNASQAQTGTVQFMVNGTAFGTPVNVVGGSTSRASATATLVTTTLAVGTNTITAVYSGDTNFTGSTSGSTPVTISTAPTGPDLSLTLASSPSFTVGTNATYDWQVSNNGSSATTGTITVTFTLPTGLGFVSGGGNVVVQEVVLGKPPVGLQKGGRAAVRTPQTLPTNDGSEHVTCAATGQVATCTFLAGGGIFPPSGSLGSGINSFVFPLKVSVAQTAVPSATTVAVVADPGDAEPSLGAKTASVTTTVTPAVVPDMTITSQHTGNFVQGQVGATYTITASNSGNAATTAAVSVVDTLPAGLSATAMAGSGWTCTLATLTCTRSDALAAFSSYAPIILTVNVAANAASGTNTAVVSGGGETNTTNDSATDPTTITTPPDMTVTSAHTGSFSQGQVGATYTLTATNSGTGPTSGTVSVVDTLPASLTATAMSGSGWSCNFATATCTRSDVLAAATSYPAITLTVTVANNAPASVNNVVTVSGGGEINTSNDSFTDPTTINAVGPDMTIAKSHTGNFNVGQVGATYNITVKNSGGAATTAAVNMVDTLPTGLTATAITGTGWACTLGTLSCTRSDSLAGGASYPAITLTVNVAVNAPPSVTNTAVVSGGGETNTTNDTATDVTAINVPDLTIAKSHTGNFTIGQIGATYTITASNVGTGSTVGTVTVVDTLPASLTATAMAGTGWACTVATTTCTRSDVLANGSSYPAITLTVTVATSAPSSVTNNVAVSGGAETNLANDTAADVTAINAPILAITKTHTGNFTLGQVGATYTIAVSNSGTNPTTAAVNVVDTLPTGLTATAISGTGWACTLATLTCTRSDVLANGSAYPAITLTVNVAANAPVSVTNTAVASGGGAVGNATANDVTGISAPDMTIAKSHSGNFAQGQVGAAYTITASNVGTGTTNGTVTVVDTLPAGLTVTAMSGTGWACTLATLTCTRSDVLANGAAYPAITLTVNVAANAGASVTNMATVSGGGEVNLANDTASDVTTITTATATLSVNALVFTAQDATVPSAAKPITITNNGTGALNFSAAPAFSGTNASDFSAGAGTTCAVGTPVPPSGGTCTVNAVFTPGAAGARGQAILTFTDNASPATTQTVTLNGTGVDFSPSGPPTPVTVTAGGQAMFTIGIAPATGGFANAITFSATGLPMASTVSFNPTSVTPGATATSTVMTITTTARNSGLPTRNGHEPTQTPYLFVFLWSLASAMLLFMLMKLRKTGRRGLAPALYVAVVLMAAVGIVGCTNTPTGTPAGTSTITVTATSGSLSHNITVTLSVQ